MRSAVKRLGKDPAAIEPLVPVDLVIDHSVQVDYAGSEAPTREIPRWSFAQRTAIQISQMGNSGVQRIQCHPAGIGIVHQVNLEYLAKGVFEREGVYFPDSLVGTIRTRR
jgi:aconitate hydratase